MYWGSPNAYLVAQSPLSLQGSGDWASGSFGDTQVCTEDPQDDYSSPVTTVSNT